MGRMIWGYLARVAGFLAGLMGLGGFLWPFLKPIFFSSLFLNLFIIGVFGIGLMLSLAHMLRLTRSFKTVKGWEADSQDFLVRVRRGTLTFPAFLASVPQAFQPRLILTVSGSQALQTRYQSVCEAAHATNRYLMGGLVFLGLLGTFFGLSVTIQGIAEVIAQMPTHDTGGGEVFFEALKQSLHKPLDGMGTAFGASLFGLSASLVLGFVELQMSGLSNRFLSLLEGFCGVVASQGHQSLDGREEASGQPPFSLAYVNALCGHVSEHLETLQKTLHAAEVERYHFYSGLQQTFQKMQHLVEEIQGERPLFRKLYEGQRMGHGQLQGIAESLTTLCEAPPLLANLAGELRTLLEKAGDRQVSLQRETSETLRREIRMLTKALSHDWERRLDPSSGAP